MDDGMNGYQPPEIGGLDGEEDNGIATYGADWVWETYYVAYVNGAVAADTVVVTFCI